MNAPKPIHINLPDEETTAKLAATLADASFIGDVLALEGELGAGKTVFARAFIQTKAKSPQEVPSPTFTLLQTYDLKDGMIFHFDLYRLNAPEDALELGIEEAFEQGISLIEWPERLGGFLPKDHLLIALSYTNATNRRCATLYPAGSWKTRILEVGLA